MTNNVITYKPLESNWSMRGAAVGILLDKDECMLVATGSKEVT
jgi:hypothetical protein